MNIEQLLPNVYYEDSRDFAYIARLFELIFNYMKTGADCVKNNYTSDKSAVDSSLVELLADTLGFTCRHSYDNDALTAIAGSFQELLRNKGSLYSIELAINLLINAQQTKGDKEFNYACELHPEYDPDDVDLIIYLPDNLQQVTLLEDLLDYILPAGMLYKILKIQSTGGFRTSTTSVFADTNIIHIVRPTNKELASINIEEASGYVDSTRTDQVPELFREIANDLSE